MGYACAVAECKSTEKTKKERKHTLVFHRFPLRNKELCDVWEAKCRRMKKIEILNSRICSDHFKEEDYDDDMKNRLLGLPQKRRLKANAVPSVFEERGQNSYSGKKYWVDKGRTRKANISQRSQDFDSDPNSEEIETMIEFQTLVGESNSSRDSLSQTEAPSCVEDMIDIKYEYDLGDADSAPTNCIHFEQNQSSAPEFNFKVTQTQGTPLNQEMKCEPEEVETMDCQSETEVWFHTGLKNDGEGDFDTIRNSSSQKRSKRKRSCVEKDPLEIGTAQKNSDSESDSDSDDSGNSKSHEQKNTAKKPFTCDICGNSFTRKSSLNTHVRKFHIDGKIVKYVEKPYICGTCGKCYAGLTNLKEHVKNTHGDDEEISLTDEKPFKCEYCGKRFTSKSYLNVHTSTHTGEGMFTCVECGKSFTKGVFEAHMRTHTGVKPFQCDECEKCFTKQNKLTIHKRTHTGDRPYKCEQCEKSFTRPDWLTVHKRTHTGEKPFKCDLCERCFARSDKLSVHKKSHAPTPI